ncbi:hypothetical protein AgCh_037871 [Apium graveolens]
MELLPLSDEQISRELLGVSDVDTIKELIERGNATRSTCTTGANEKSSRSHAILQLAIKKTVDGKELKPAHLVGKLSFIDLAGSERGADMTDNDKQTRALDNDQGHIPFRGSKLIEVLRDSFVGPVESSSTSQVFQVKVVEDYYEPNEETREQDNRFQTRNSTQTNAKNTTTSEARKTNSDEEVDVILKVKYGVVQHFPKRVMDHYGSMLGWVLLISSLRTVSLDRGVYVNNIEKNEEFINLDDVLVDVEDEDDNVDDENELENDYVEDGDDNVEDTNMFENVYGGGVPLMNVIGNIHGGNDKVRFNVQYVKNVIRDERKKMFHISDAQGGLDLLHRLNEESGSKYFNRIEVDEENHLKCLVWIDLRCLMAYQNFGDVVAFDTSYRTNRYTMPFVPFTGVNHHYQSMIFGFSLMRDEHASTF